jgi:hypothetical protein
LKRARSPTRISHGRLARRLKDDAEFSGFALLREDDDVVPVTRVRLID